MSEGFNIDISKLPNQFKRLALRNDFRGNNDGILSGAEISLFLNECQEESIEYENQPWYKKIVDEKNLKSLNKNFELENDATRVDRLQVIGRKDNIDESCTNQVDHKKFLERLHPREMSNNSPIRSNFHWSIEKFEKVLDNMLSNKKFEKSVLKGKAEAFIKAGEKYQIDPRFILAVVMTESGRGISSKSLKLNNVGGLRQSGDYMKFETVDDCLMSVAKTLESRFWEGYTTPLEVAHSGRYCEKNAASEWLSNVDSYINTFNREYGY